jgi:pyrimidine operon attenuation protein/uracil phosphoribosyltransferase
MRIAHEIVESNRGVENLVLVGIRKRGVPLAKRIAHFIYEFEGVEVPVGALDITLYRDDVQMIASNPLVGPTDISVDIHESVVVLIDDVLFTGRTVRAALDELIDFGRPKIIRLAVLVDRGHREFPIRADSVGKNVPTSNHEVVRVFLKETDEEEKVVLNEIAPDDVDDERENGKVEEGKNKKKDSKKKKKRAKVNSKHISKSK